MRFTPYVYNITEYRVIDGDTIEVGVDLGFRLRYMINVRLDGVNAPETRGAERAAGLVVKRYVEAWMAERKDKTMVRSIKLDKYSDRVVGDIVTSTESLCEALTAKHYVTKVTPDGSVAKFASKHLELIEQDA